MKKTANILPLIIWLNQLFGLFGIFYVDFNLFLSLSPISLIFTFLIVLFYNVEFSLKQLSVTLLIISLSFICEIIGVNSGILFGSYEYGNNLAPLIFGVPLVIGLNWFVLTISCGNISHYIFSKNKFFSISFGSFLMLILDFVMEQVSGNIDFWYFNDKNLLFNYITWFLLGLLNQYIYQSFMNKKNLIISINIYFSFFVFFLILLFFLP
ncbi:MAG: carotenoid biosynthesis protein [Cytophagales bacterium]